MESCASLDAESGQLLDALFDGLLDTAGCDRLPGGLHSCTERLGYPLLLLEPGTSTPKARETLASKGDLKINTAATDLVAPSAMSPTNNRGRFLTEHRHVGYPSDYPNLVHQSIDLGLFNCIIPASIVEFPDDHRAVSYTHLRAHET